MRAANELALEVIDNPQFDPELRLRLETWWSNSYRNSPVDLEAIAEAADFMELEIR
jgi:hypothetical protein